MWLIVLCAAALGGVAVGDLSPLDLRWLLFGGGVALLGAGLVWRRRGWRMLALITCVAAAGGVRATLAPRADAAVLAPYAGLTVRLRGVVAQPPTSGPTATQLSVDALELGPAVRDPPQPSASPSGSADSADSAAAGLPGAGAGAVRVRVVGDPPTLDGVAPGETLVLQGRLLASDGSSPPTLLFPRIVQREPPRAFEPSAQLGGIRAAAQAGILRHLREPQASLAAGVLLGGAGHLDPEFRLRLQRSGLAHLLAIDGFKQVLVAVMLRGLTVRLLGARAGAITVLAGIIAYTLLSGAHPAAIRAGLMVGLATLASLNGRVADPLTSVLVAATVMAAFDPRVLLDVGLQLSLSATLGIVLLWPRLAACLKGVPRWVAEPAGLTVAVTAATLPVTLSAFQLVSLVSPLAHVLAVPLLPLVLVSAALVAVVSPIPELATGAAWLAWLPSTLMVDIINTFGSLPGAALSTGRLPPLACAVLAAGLLGWGILGLPEASAARLRVRPALGVANAVLGSSLMTTGACLTAVLAAVVLLLPLRPDGRLHVQHLTSARGEAVFIRGPTGRTVLVVGGRLDGAQVASQVADRLAVWEHRLDVVVQLDPEVQAGLGLTLGRYPAEQRLDGSADARLDLGGGAVVDLYAAGAEPVPAVSISFGRVWLALVGRPPLPDAAEAAPPQTRAATAAELVSDGLDVWTPDSRAYAVQLPWAAAARVRSGPTTSAARPGSAS